MICRQAILIAEGFLEDLLRIRRVTGADKEQVLEFCQNTFSWGDYIDRVWDTWAAEGAFLALEYEKRPVGICHAYFAKKQTWIEGLRVDPKLRRRRFASQLVLRAEKMGKNHGCGVARMLIAQDNTKSLKLASSLGYDVEEKWWLYNLKPRKQVSKARPLKDAKEANHLKTRLYSDSWKWFPLDGRIISSLIKRHRLLKHGNGFGIWNRSTIDADVLQIGFLSGQKQEISQIVRFVQNRAYDLGSKRIQILIPNKTELSGVHAEKRMLFCLVRKNL